MIDTSSLNVEVPQIPSSSYPVLIGRGLLNEQSLAKFVDGRRNIIVTDRNVFNCGLLNALGNIDLLYIIDPPGEINKNIQTIINIIEMMESANMGRDSIITAIGGGTVGDMAGFAASIFKRGIPVLQIPTTTVAQADSSIGGKTGVDSSLSKNAYGCFHHPKAVIIDTDTLKTLKQREYLSGLSESVKHAMILNDEYFNFFEQNIQPIIDRDPQILASIADYNCRIKALVVQQDPYEKNMRRILNYGHTIGHAVETLSGYELLHGECVAIGIVAAGLIEIELGIGNAERLQRTKDVLVKLSQPIEIPRDISHAEIIRLLKHDKKAVDGWPRFALIEGIGKPFVKDSQWAHPVNADVVAKVLEVMTSSRV